MEVTPDSDCVSIENRYERALSVPTIARWNTDSSAEDFGAVDEPHAAANETSTISEAGRRRNMRGRYRPPLRGQASTLVEGAGVRGAAADGAAEHRGAVSGTVAPRYASDHMVAGM